ncbi:hypothetical protein [Nonomuraea sp. GTA35]|uniref:hypothetical protein n=1 Tax=Nonomuraea sp. GTA35 TaxID=1676746 RepID=UPI0035C041D9
MRYVLIPATGELNVTGGGENAHLADVEDQNPTRVPLAPLDGLPPITGWVNSAGSPTYPLNEVGGQTLVNLGAAAGDYYGPVVITGWDEAAGTGIGINSDMSAEITAAYEAATS